MDEIVLAVVVAFILDLALGDPQWLPHPVRWIGHAAKVMERLMTALFGRNRLSGALFTVVIVAGAYIAVWAIVEQARSVNQALGFGVYVFFLYASLSARDLADHASRVFRSLNDGNLDEARENLSMIVGRDTSNLDEREIARAAVETTAEGTVDGVLAPLMFAVIGGPPLAMAYKAANTLDSMVGYNNERYGKFGWASARLDDVLNYVPARIARALYPLASLACGLSAAECWRISFRDGRKSPSPNAAISEAALAGALGVQLGGVNIYLGRPESRPRLGDRHRDIEPADIRLSIRWMYAACVAGLALFAGMRTLILMAWQTTS